MKNKTWQDLLPVDIREREIAEEICKETYLSACESVGDDIAVIGKAAARQIVWQGDAYEMLTDGKGGVHTAPAMMMAGALASMYLGDYSGDDEDERYQTLTEFALSIIVMQLAQEYERFENKGMKKSG